MAMNVLRVILKEFKNSYQFFAFNGFLIVYNVHILAGWQSGYAAACKAVYAGSIPASASKL